MQRQGKVKCVRRVGLLRIYRVTRGPSEQSGAAGRSWERQADCSGRDAKSVVCIADAAVVHDCAARRFGPAPAADLQVVQRLNPRGEENETPRARADPSLMTAGVPTYVNTPRDCLQFSTIATWLHQFLYKPAIPSNSNPRCAWYLSAICTDSSDEYSAGSCVTTATRLQIVSEIYRRMLRSL